MTQQLQHQSQRLMEMSFLGDSPGSVHHHLPSALMGQQQQQQHIHNTSSSSHHGSIPGGVAPVHHNNNNNVPMSMLWGSDMAGVRHPGEKPKRPLSAYNFYFQLERERIIACDEADRDLTVIYTVEDVSRLTLMQQAKAKENKPKEKRSHRKTHGKISFGDLARTIANKWKRLDKDGREIFEGSAMVEKERYRKELGEWNKQMKKWKDAASKMASVLQYPNNLSLNGNNLSNHESNASTPYNNNNNNALVTPDQIPKKTIYPTNSDNMDMTGAVSPNTQMIHAIAEQQRFLNRNKSDDTNGSFAGRSTSSHTIGQKQQQQQLLPLQQNQRHAQLPAASNVGNRLNGLRASTFPQSNFVGNGLNGGSGHGLLDYGDDMGHAYNMNDMVGEEDFYMNEALSHASGAAAGGLINNNFDYDEVSDETYRMAQMMLPPQNALTQRNMTSNGGISPFQQQQRRMVNQRRMKMLMLMQQRYRRSQMMLMQMNQGANPYNGAAGGLMDPEQYDPTLDDLQQQDYMDQLDDAASFMDQSATANHFMMNPATAAAAAMNGSFLHRPQQQAQQRQRQLLHSQQRDRRVDELNITDGQHAAMEDQYHTMANMLHGGTYEDRV
jgi:hypothetical protein